MKRKYFVLTDEGMGLEAVHIGEFDSFDEASDAADLRAETKEPSIWILSAADLRFLGKTIEQTLERYSQ